MPGRGVAERRAADGRAARSTWTPSSASSAGGPAARSSRRGRARAGFASTPRAAPRTQARLPATGRNAAFALAREALRLAELHGARPDLTLQVTGLEAGEGLNTVPSSGSLTADLRAWTQDDLDWALEQVLAIRRARGRQLRYEDLGGPPPLERTPAVAALAEAAIALGAELGHAFGETVGRRRLRRLVDGARRASRRSTGSARSAARTTRRAEYIETASFATRCGVVAGLVAAVDAGLLTP